MLEKLKTMKTKSAFVWALCLSLLWVLLMLGGLLWVAWDVGASRFFDPFMPQRIFFEFSYNLDWAFPWPLIAVRTIRGIFFHFPDTEVEYPITAWMFFLLVPLVVGCCIFLAVLRLRESRRAWTGYAAALAALVLFAFNTYGVVSALVCWHEDSKGEYAAIEAHGHPDQLVEFLQTSPYRESQSALYELLGGANSGYTAEMLQQLADTFLSEHKNGNMRALRKLERVAAQPNVDVETLVMLAETPDTSVQSIAASHRKTPVEILRKLSRKKSRKIDAELAFNENTPRDILHDLANSPDARIRRGVARNPNTNSEDLAMLAQSSYNGSLSSEILWGVAGNPNTPTETLHVLANFPDDNIRSRAETTLLDSNEKEK